MGKTIREHYNELAALIGKDVVDDRLRAWFRRQVKSAKRLEQPLAGKEVDVTGRVIADLNRLTGLKWGCKEDTVKLIKVLLGKGFTEEDVLKVNEVKCEEWLGDAKMERYLRPRTLYNVNKFEGYLQQWVGKEKRVVKVKTVELKDKQRQWFEFGSFKGLIRHLESIGDEKAKMYKMPDVLRVYCDNYVDKLKANEGYEMEQDYFQLKREKLKTG